MTDFITLDDAAALVGPGVQARTLRTAREKGLLRCARVGREWRTTAEEIERYKERLWESSSSSTAKLHLDPVLCLEVWDAMLEAMPQVIRSGWKLRGEAAADA